MIEYTDKDGYIKLHVEGSLINIISDVAKMLHVLHVKLAYQNVLSARALEEAFKDPEYIEAIFKPDENDRKLLEE